MFFSLLYYSPSAYEKKLSDEDWKLNGETSIPVKNYHFRDFALMHNHHQIWCFLFTSAEKWIFHAFLYVFAEKRSGMDLAILSFGRDDMCSTLHHHITSCECSIHVNIFNIAHCTLKSVAHWTEFSACSENVLMISIWSPVSHSWKMHFQCLFLSRQRRRLAHILTNREEKKRSKFHRVGVWRSRLPRYQVRDYTFFFTYPPSRREFDSAARWCGW